MDQHVRYSSELRRKTGLIALIVAILLILGGCVQTMQPPEIPLSEAVAMSQNREIEKIIVEDKWLLITTTEGSEFRTFKDANTRIYDIKGLNLEGVVVEVKALSGINWDNLLINYLPLIISLLIVGGLLFFVFRRSDRFKRQ